MFEEFAGEKLTKLYYARGGFRSRVAERSIMLGYSVALMDSALPMFRATYSAVDSFWILI